MAVLLRNCGSIARRTCVALPQLHRAAVAAKPVPIRRHFAGKAGKESLDCDIPSVTHFRVSQQDHPLKAKPHQQTERSQHMEPDEAGIVSLMPNHVWTEAEIGKRMENLYKHKPKTISDRIAHGCMYGLYKVFNAITGFKPENTPVKAVEWRLIVLESVAGVPGFMAAMFRHFRSLRTLKRDHGWIHTLLEEAENERMHLLLCMKMFEASLLTRAMVVAAQVVMTPLLASVYLVSPHSVHRFVGYLEETACHTYANIIHQIETPGTPLHKEWSKLPAPKLAKNYYKLADDAMWVDCLKCMFADESNHRDVNHTFATMATDDPNPFVAKHQADAVHAWRLEQEGSFTDVGCYRTAASKGTWHI